MVGYWGGDELAVAVSIGSGKMVSLQLGRLVQTLVISISGPVTLGTEVLRVFSVNFGEFATFSCFWEKSANMDGVLRAMVVVEDTRESKEVEDDVIEEKTGIFVEISLADSETVE